VDPRTSAKQHLLLITSPDGWAHLVGEAAFARSRDGLFRAGCGSVCLPG
jgi:hypothetical protein